MAVMETDLVQVRNTTYRMFVDLGRAPTVEEVAGEAMRPRASIEAAWSELHHAHALVLNQATGEIRMANPFSAVPTAYRVHAAGRWWYGNCAWDAVGICAALHADGRIEASCPDCGGAIALQVREARIDDDQGLLFHCLVPAARWWEDIGFT
jgi:hypothetical protein